MKAISEFGRLSRSTKTGRAIRLAAFAAACLASLPAHAQDAPPADAPSAEDVAEEYTGLEQITVTARKRVEKVPAVRPGEWVAVSAAAGVTGSLASPVARNLGAKAVGIARGPDKCRYLRDELRVNRAIVPDFRGAPNSDPSHVPRIVGSIPRLCLDWKST